MSHWHGSGGQGLRLPLAVPYSGPTGTQCNPRRAPPPGPFLLLRVGPGAGVGPAMPRLLRTRIPRDPQDLIPVQQVPPTRTRRDEDPELYGAHGIGPYDPGPRFSMNSAGAESGNPRFPIRPGTGNGAPAARGPIGRKSGVGKSGNPPCDYSRHDPGLSGCCLSPSESHADSGLRLPHWHLLNCQEPPADGG